MKTRVSQFELQPSVEPDSNRAESFASQSELAADLKNKSSSVCSDPFLTDSETHSSRIPFYLIGLLLALTAIAKLWMLLTDSFADVRVGIPKEILWLSVAFELWLAWQNFRIHDYRVMAFVNTVVFVSFGIFATLRLILGYGSCGCSGSLELPAWIFIIIDLFIVVWFTISAQQRTRVGQGFVKLAQNWSSWSPEKRGRWAGLGLFASLILTFQLPSTAPLRAMLLGEPPLKATVRIEGDLILNQQCNGVVTIENRSSQPARIIGVSRSCRCFDLVDDPVGKIIPAKGSLALTLVINPIKPGSLYQRVELFLDHPNQLRVNVNVFGSTFPQ